MNAVKRSVKKGGDTPVTLDEAIFHYERTNNFPVSVAKAKITQTKPALLAANFSRSPLAKRSRSIWRGNISRGTQRAPVSRRRPAESLSPADLAVIEQVRRFTSAVPFIRLRTGALMVPFRLSRPKSGRLEVPEDLCPEHHSNQGE